MAKVETEKRNSTSKNNFKKGIKLPHKSQSIIHQTIKCLGTSIWTYFFASAILGLNIAFNFNLVLAFIKQNVFTAYATQNQSLIIRAIILAVSTLVIGLPIWVVTAYTIQSITKKILTKTRLELFEKLLSLPSSEFEASHSGDLITRSTSDINKFDPFFRSYLPNCFTLFFMGSIGLGSIFIMNWKLGLLALGIGVMILIVSVGFSKRIRSQTDLVQKSLSKNTSQVMDIVQGIHVTKMYQLESKTQAMFVQSNEAWISARLKLTKIQSFYETCQVFFTEMTWIGILILGLFLLLNRESSIGIVVASIHLTQNASSLFSSISNQITGMQSSLTSTNRVFDVMEREQEQSISGALSETQQTSHHMENTQSFPIFLSQEHPLIEFQHVDFQYEQDSLIIQDFNLKVSSGQLIALVGESGSGKSSIIKILMGLYPISGGILNVNGKPLNSYSLSQLRQLSAYVPQGAFLFDGTIEENILYGKPSASDEEVIAVAKAAFAHDFITEFKDQYQTKVGERGVHLSGGQRQRIAIARALLKNAPLLLLDEATSALDTESEQLVQKALNILMQGRTTISVAHRLSTILLADKICVLNDGQIVEDGTHEELLKHQGPYSSLYHAQYSY